MLDKTTALYHRLPASARSLAATLRGLYLRRWRYGPHSERLVHEALERDSWSPERWRKWREARLSLLLHRAATRVPFYRDYWQARRRSGDGASWEILENWPVLEKDAVRENPRAFVGTDCETRRMYHEQTSGTTGKPLDIWRARSTANALQAITDARTEHWYSIPPRARWARLGGQLVTPIAQRRPPFWVWNAAMHQLYMSTYHLAPDLIPSYLDALERYGIVYLAGYSSALVALAQEAVRLGRRNLRMLAAFTNAEPLHPDQRAVISAAFQCPVVQTYGMTEGVAAGSECPHGRLHQWPEFGHLEVLQDGESVAPGTSGEFVATGLLNFGMVLVRYRVGDRGSLAAETEACTCGRSLPLISSVDGRSTDLLLTPDGRQVFWLNPVFYGLPVRQSQIVQESLTRVAVRVVPAEGFGPDTGRTIQDRLRARLGEVDVEMSLVDQIPRSSNGKLQAIVCQLSAEERQAALAAARTSSDAMSHQHA